MLVIAPSAHGAVYWALNIVAPGAPAPADGSVGRANLNGTGADQWAFPFGSACGVAVDADHLYWGGGEGIVRSSLDGFDVDLGFVSGVNTHCAVAVDDAHVYWLSGAHPLDASGIGRANLDGTGVQDNWITGLDVPRGMTVNGGHVYWVTADGSVGRADTDGTHVVADFIQGPGSAGSIGVAVDDTHIYWSNTWLGTIGRANLDGTGVNQSFIVDPSPRVAGITFVGLAVDDTHLYWDEYPGRIGRAKLDGSDVELNLVPQGSGVTRGVAVDGRTAVAVPMSASLASMPYGRPFTVTATPASTDALQSSPAIPTGTVQFLVDDEDTGPPEAVDASGAATATLSDPVDVGSSVAARYSGDATYLPAVEEFTPAIRAAATSTRLTSSANPAVENGDVRVVATVENIETDVEPFGSVTFYIDGEQVLEPVPLDEHGQVEVIASELPAGDFTVEARYRDDTADIPDFTESRDSYIQHVAAQPSVTLTEPPAPTPSAPVLKPASDVSAPRLAISAKRRVPLTRALKRGLLIDVTCSEPCRTEASAILDKRAAERLHLGRGHKPVVLGRGHSATAARHRVLRVKLTRRARTALTRARTVTLTLRVRAYDAAGNVSVATRHVRLTRRARAKPTARLAAVQG